MTNTIIHCPTEEEAEKVVAKIGWWNGDREDTCWNIYKDQTCYRVDDDKIQCNYTKEHYSDTEYKDYTFLTAAEFLGEKYSVGDIVLCEMQEGKRVIIFKNKKNNPVCRMEKTEAPSEIISADHDTNHFTMGWGTEATNGEMQNNGSWKFIKKYPSIESAPVLKYKNPKYYSERKFKVGDWVIIHKPIVNGFPHWVINMEEYNNKKCKIEKILDNRCVLLEDCNGWTFSVKWLELLPPKVEEESTSREDFNEARRYYYGIRADNIIFDEYNQPKERKTIMNRLSSLSAAIRRLLSADEKALYKAGYIDECRKYTDKAREEVMNLLCEAHKKELVEFAKEEIETNKEEDKE